MLPQWKLLLSHQNRPYAQKSCRKRYIDENAREIPNVIDWSSSDWVCFQRSRERWLGEFAEELTSSAKARRPNITVTHQFSPVLAGWRLGQSSAIATASDYTSGDFYGGKHQHFLGAKILAAFSRNIPFEFMTSRCVNLYDHTSMKSEEEMFCEAAATLSNGGAYFFIDAINPDGTLSEDVYDRFSRVSEMAKPFKDIVQIKRPALAADTGLYFSMASMIDERDDGTHIRDSLTGTNNMSYRDMPILRELIGTAVILDRANIPYRIVTSESNDIRGIRTVILNNTSFMSYQEVNQLRSFVCDGGTLIATGESSLRDLSGTTSGDFQLADVFGVSFSGKKSKTVSYLTYNGDIDVPPGVSDASKGRPQYILCDVPSPLVSATTASVLAGVSECWYEPYDESNYASIHSNPPGPASGHAGLAINHYGNGKCIYLYSSLLGLQNHAQQRFGELLLRNYAPSGIVLTTNVPACVGMTLLASSVDDSYLLCFVNWQKDLPNVPVKDLSVQICLPGGAIVSDCVRVSDGSKMDIEKDGDIVTIKLVELGTIEMISLSFYQ